MFKVLLCISTQHDWRLVILAAAVCVAATMATFYLYSKAPRFAGWKRWIWLAMTGVVAGSGIWTTHFVAMLAFETGLPTGYSPGATLGSLLVAIASVTFGFAVAIRAQGRRALAVNLCGGVLVGLGITFMHYVGMLGYRTAGEFTWDPVYVGASVAIGALFAAAALHVGQRDAGPRRQAAAAGLLALGIVGMHFTGMSAVTVIPDPTVTVPAALMSDPVMAVIAVAVTAVIMITAIGGVLLDTTMRDANLRRLREALDVMPEGLAFYDASDRLVAWNTRYADLCRANDAEPCVGMSFYELVHTTLVHGAYPDAIGREKEWLAERKAAYQGDIDSLTQKTSAGRWLRVTDRKTSDGGTVSVSVDITDLKQARDDAQESAERAEFAERLARVGHWRVDVATRTIVWSSQLYATYGLDPDATLDLDQVIAMTHPDDASAVQVRMARLMDGGEPEASLTRIVRKDGQIRLLSSNSCPQLDENGRVVAVIGTLVDVTEQKQLEEELRQAKREAEAAAAVKAEFLANMSHELRTPLTSIVGFTGLAAAQPGLPPLARTYVDRVGDASRALLCTVNDILDFSKLEAGQVSFHVQPISLSQLGKTTLELFTPQAAAKDLSLTFEMNGLDRVMADPDRLRQILLNLVGNAVKFTPSGGVTLRISRPADSERIEASVIDTGPGIPADKVGALFKRFSQVDGSLTRAHGGTGLGLAICKGLAEAMGGQIGVESTVGGGSRFWFTVRAVAAPESEDVPADGQASARQACPGLRVLVVDDHPANRELARLFLESAGAEIAEAVDGEEGVRMASELPFDAILMDMRMPRLNGPEAFRRIRETPGPNDITPVIAFTAAGDGENAEDLRRLGFDDVVAKPIDPQALLTAVARATDFLSQSFAHAS